jgi:hypothetical protein
MSVETRVNLARPRYYRKAAAVDSHALRRLVSDKLADGRLPLNSIPRVWGGPANGETCDVCDIVVTQHEFIMEGISLAPGKKPLQMHVGCFYLWDEERRISTATAVALSNPPPRGE